MSAIAEIYDVYLDCLNKRDLDNLSKFVHENVRYNGNEIAISGYRQMLEDNYREIPDLHFNAELILSDHDYVACRLHFTCSPTGNFLNLPINGKKISFFENVFYRFRAEKIEEVWSVIDKIAIERQL